MRFHLLFEPTVRAAALSSLSLSFARAGVRQGGVLVSPSAAHWAPRREDVKVSASLGMGVPIGQGAQLELVCSQPLAWREGVDRTERWQLAIGLGIG